jgi:hypothetical protein
MKFPSTLAPFPLLVALVLWTMGLESAYADTVLVTGTVANRAGQALPGCTVSVVSGDYRTAPSTTDADGRFDVDLALRPNTPSYFLEIYWGRELKLRKQLYRQPNNGPLWGTEDGILHVSRISLGL